MLSEPDPRWEQQQWRKKLQHLNPKFSSANTKLKTKYVLQAIARTHGLNSVVANVETHDSGCSRSKDLYGFIDLLVDHDRAIQACGVDWQSHIEKFRYDCPKMRWWLSGSQRSLELWGWRKVTAYKKNGSRAMNKVWMPRIQLVTWKFLQGEEEPTWIDFQQLIDGATTEAAIMLAA